MAHALEAIYPHVPVWAQNLGIAMYGVLYRHERFGGGFSRYVAEFRERDRWPEDRMREHVTAELRRRLVQAFSEVPYYRDVWAAAGIGMELLQSITPETLSRLPCLPKRDLRMAPERLVSSQVRRKQKLISYSTSGSTGTPIRVISTPDARRRFYAAREVRSFGWAGVSIRSPRSMIGGRLVVPKAESQGPFHRYNPGERQLYFSAFHISPANVAQYVGALDRYRPRVFTGYAYSHFLLARMMAEQGVTLDYEPQALVLGSEKLTPTMKTVIRQSFRARAYEEYGAGENCGLATECEHGRLHVSPDFGIIEIVDDAGRPVPPGVEGRILCTGLLNEAQPLIRYEIGDLGVWSDRPCPCGRNHLPVLEQVVGRIEDAVVGPDGREMVRFHGIFVGLPHVLEGQVIQEALDQLTVRVIATDALDAEEEKLIRKRFEERLGNVGVRIERVQELERSERGKLRAVISHVRRDSAEAPVVSPLVR